MLLKITLTCAIALAACQEGAESTNCKEGSCTVKIGGDSPENTYCSQCATEGEAPINGACAVDNGFCTANNAGVCTECATTVNIFMYKGGCYTTSEAPGQTICTAADSGKCTSAGTGYFIIPAEDTDASHQSVVSCGDAEGAAVNNDKTYKGVKDCVKCNAPGPIQSPSGTAAATCTECGNNKIVKTDTSGTSCVEESACSGGFFVSGQKEAQSKDKKCIACSAETYGVADCNECSPRTDDPTKAGCTACSGSKKPNAAGDHCYTCEGSGDTKDCATCSSDNVCETCIPGKILRIDAAKTCIAEAECTGGFFVSTDGSGGKTCIKCTDQTNGVTECAVCEARTDDRAKAKCLACSGENKKPNVTGDQCYDCSVPNCEKCKAPDQCEACSTGEPLETGQCSEVRTECHESCSTCLEGAMNNEPEKCTGCKDLKYLKIEDSGKGSGTCVPKGSCGADHFEVETDRKCYPCNAVDNGGVDGCAACTPRASTRDARAVLIACSACTDTRRPNTDGTRCIPCSVDGCGNCNEENVCAKCASGRRLTPTRECVDKCGKLEGYFDGDDGTCKACSSVCKACSGEDPHQCTSCPARKVLKYTVEGALEHGGTCVDECTINTNGCAECGATIGEARYCSKCSDPTQAPLNGNCTASARAADQCEKVVDGACAKCKEGSFLFEGGCYETARQPGMQICKDAAGSDGKCKTCANTLPPSADTGACPSCPAGCATCTAAGQTHACQTCLAGYYLDSDRHLCTKCTESSGGIHGVADCASCDPPVGSSGPVTCYVKRDGTGGGDSGSGGGSANKSGLSTGAIAGISVAAIVVVGGLVGFLCWWFICRGRA
ncbi:VSP [Giardia lamblia P15]|uniref:VSP n=1 Tax=Giardia intestinalis (strain P15) TaxID=658858 RepID=E1EVZ6_GIAIA|nr:VSP [Giardia lamblia P15]